MTKARGNSRGRRGETNRQKVGVTVKSVASINFAVRVQLVFQQPRLPLLLAWSFGYPQPGAPCQVPMRGVAAYPLYGLRRLQAPRAVGAYSGTRGVLPQVDTLHSDKAA
eukprot:1298520-Rhodomonas_salina.1